jgi:serine/threonine protein kinase
MGEVYLAEDISLKRRVAIKVLPQSFSLDKERSARFEREARLLASLNHPNIAIIHGLEKSDNQQFLVMELVEGETLAERIKKGSMSVEETLEACRQIAEGLESAHEKGIVHRDLKPANIKVTPEGKVKILDFGIAKAFHEQRHDTDSSKSQAITDEMTRPGLILGTAAYMSPEQAKGKAVDKRTDIWAFGCVLFEMLTGKRAFGDETVSEVIASVLKGEPEWDALPKSLPAPLRRLLERSLEKDPNRRLRDTGDARFDLEDAHNWKEPLEIESKVGIRASAWRWAIAALLSVITALAGIWIGRSLAPKAPLSVSKLEISLPEGLQIDSAPAISPDGRIIAYTASQGEGSESNLYLRPIDATDAWVVPDSEGASEPFFSPDGSKVAFFTSDKLCIASVSGGQPIELAASPMDFGGSWGFDDMILFVPDLTGGIFRIPAAGGEPKLIVTPDVSRGEYAYTWPQHLPDGKHVLFYVWGGRERSGTALLSLETEQWQFIIPDRYGRYVPSGHMTVYDNTSATLRGAVFDPTNPVVLGDDVPILNNFFWKYQKVREYVAFSTEGTMIYAAGNPKMKRLVWIDSAGKMVPLDEEWRAYSDPKISPDGHRVVFLDEGEIWIKDLRRGTSSRIETADRGLDLNFQPLWSSNSRLIFASNRSGDWELYSRELDGKTQAEILLQREGFQHPESVALDGTIAFFEGGDLWLLRPGADPEPYLVTSFSTWQARFSPDGNLIAYISNATGRPEVYIQRLEGSDKQIMVSLEGGWDPAWSPDGRTLYYRRGKELWAAKIDPLSLESVERPRLLKSALMDSSVRGRSYDIAPDGRILVIQPHPNSVPNRLNVVLNWFEELKRLISPER